MALRLLALLALVLPLALAGCASDPPAAEGPVLPAEPSAPAGEWVRSQYEGEFATTAVFAASSLVLGPGTFEVPDGASTAFLNGTIDGPVPDGSLVRLFPEGCDQPDCRIDVDTQGGAFSAEAVEPQAGAWSIVVFADTAAQAGTWSIEVTAFVASTDGGEEE